MKKIQFSTNGLANADSNLLNLSEKIKIETWNYLKNYGKKNKRNISKEDLLGLKDLIKDKSIIICKADKANVLVILDKFMYYEKSENFLNSNIFSKILENDNEKKFASLNYYLDKFFKNSQLSKDQVDSLKASGHQTPFAFFLPKVHKEKSFYNLKMRPIISTVNSYNYKTAKYLGDLLQKYLREKYPDYIDSFKFAEKIRDTRGAVNSTLIGLDIESLYPSIPLEETLNLAADILKEIEFKNLEKDNIIKLLKFCTSDLTFQFNGKFYKQTSGVPMGSPLAMALSEIFLKHVEKEKIIPNFQKLGINNYFRYVDDIFIIGKENLNVQNLLLNFNSLHNNLKFTMEKESNSCLNFLDVLVVKIGDRFGTRVFRKSINPLTLHHWTSSLPFKYKINLIKTMTFRVFSISSGNFLKSELNILENIFLNSGYPLNIIKKETNQFFENLRKQGKNQKLIKKKFILELIIMDHNLKNF